MIGFANSKLPLPASRRTFVERRAAGATAPVGCATAPSPRRWTRKRNPDSAVRQGNAPRADLVDAHGLFARFVLHQVRLGNRSAVADAGQRNCFSRDPNTCSLRVVAPNIGSPLPPESGQRVAIAQADSADPFPATIENLFSELARRHLHNLAAREKP